MSENRNFRMLGSNIMDRVMSDVDYVNELLLRRQSTTLCPKTRLTTPYFENKETLGANEQSTRLFSNARHDLNLAQMAVATVPRPISKAHLKDYLPLELGALHAGARFKGQQSCSSQQYDVSVELKYVNLKESYLCGYLTIKNLTQNHPVLTTFFEAEVIGTKHRFRTRNWNASLETDMEHWGRFDHFANYYKGLLDDTETMIDIIHEPFIYQRWKEYFLVPNHRIQKVDGASYDGFYYMCYEVDSTSFAGYYFSNESDKFQKITLEYVQSFDSPSYAFR